MSIRSVVGTMLRFGGYQAVKLDALADLGLVLHLKRLLRTQSVDCVFDVGANRGQFHDLLRTEVGFGGWVVSFEPIPELCGELQARSQSDPRWRVLNYALGATTGLADLKVAELTDLSSFLPFQKGDGLAFPASTAVSRIQNVEVRRLDELFGGVAAELGFGRPYLKMDTQGFDLEVIKGAGNVVRRFVGLQSEMSVIPLYEGMPSYRESLRAFEAVGFELSGMFPVTIDKIMRLVEFDCVMINRELAVARGNTDTESK